MISKAVRVTSAADRPGTSVPMKSQEPARGLAENPLVLVVAAFVVGLAIGRWTTK